MKRFFGGILALTSICFGAKAQESQITIKGTVEFPESNAKMEVFYFDGPDRKVVDSFDLEGEKNFEKIVKLPTPGVYFLDCQKNERLLFWGENENIEVHFRGRDTAKVKIKNPPYHAMVNPGKNNELINLYNFFGYRSYQRMIAAGREQYLSGQSSSDDWKKYAKEGYGRSSIESTAYINFLGEVYADRNAVLAFLSQIKDENIKNRIINNFEKNKPNYVPFVTYKKNVSYAKEQKERLSKGKPAPEFSLPTADGKRLISIKDYRGKYLLIDFWASWCGPCRKAIPHVRKVYEKFNEKGLEVLAVSIDKDDKAWRKAMEEENMVWDQVLAPSSGKEVMKSYQFNGIPHMVLIDQKGNIIARGITPDMLEKELSKIFE